MLSLHHHPYPTSLLTFLLGVVYVRYMGRRCSRMSRSRVYFLCFWYVFILYLSGAVVLLGRRFGYIQVDGHYVGVFGYAAQRYIGLLGETAFPLAVLKFDVLFTVVTAVLIFVLAGLTTSLPRGVRMQEPFDKVFLAQGATASGYGVERTISWAGRNAFWFCGLFLVKSLASASAVILTLGAFCVYYDVDNYGHYVFGFYFVGLSMFIFANAIWSLYLVMVTLHVLSGDRVFLNHDLWRTMALPMSRARRACCRRWPRLASRSVTLLPGRFRKMRVQARALVRARDIRQGRGLP